MSEEAVPQAYQALQKAMKLTGEVSKREQGYIRALAKRYGEKPLKDRSKLDQDFAAAMKEVWQENPDDLDAATIYAEAVLDTAPWKYWEKDGQPKEGTREALKALEFVLAKNPSHPGANHYYIHAVEASPNPEKGLASAHRLLTLCPGAGHLVHMPSHIFLALGMYHDASQANEKAITADEGYITHCKVQGFYPTLYYSHNVHFLWYSLSMEGRSKYCLASGKKTEEVLAKADHGMAYVQWLKSTPVFGLVRFGKWDEILKREKPADGLFETAMWHYGRGIALVRKKQLEKAAAEAKELLDIAEGKVIECLQSPQFPAKSVTDVASAVLAAEVAGANGNTKKRIEFLEKAVAMQNALPYMEPPFWYFPTRQALGAASLEAGELAKAEMVYRKDLKKHPKNGWSLYGLMQCLRQAGRDIEADAVQQQFQQAWQYADVTLTASWF
jgi:tetratricopeptide (TPR) repeat protein